MLVGTNALLPNVSSSMSIPPSPCTDRGCFTTIASAVKIQHSANANAITRPSAARTASGFVPIRKPSTTPRTSMITADVR